MLDLARVAAWRGATRRTDHGVPPRLRGPARGRRSRRGRGAGRQGPSLADGWDRPANAPDPDDVAVEVPVPDDSSVDHTADHYEEAR